MARVRGVSSSELPSDLADIYERFATEYGSFRNQVAVLAHVPAALRHLMPMLMELRAARTLPKRYLELAIVAVSKLNECDYCVAHHKPFLVPEGISPEGVEQVLDYEAHPEFDAVDRLVVEYAIAAWTQPHRFARCDLHPAARAFHRGADCRAHPCASGCAASSTSSTTPSRSNRRS